MSELVSRLESMDGPASRDRLFAQIEQQVSRIVDRIEVHERRFTDIGGIEEKLGALEALLSERRDDVLEAAQTREVLTPTSW